MRKTIMLLVGLMTIGICSFAKSSIHQRSMPALKEDIKKEVLAKLSADQQNAGALINFHEGRPANLGSGKIQYLPLADYPATCILVVTTIYDIYDSDGNYIGSIGVIDVYVFDCEVIELAD